MPWFFSLTGGGWSCSFAHLVYFLLVGSNCVQLPKQNRVFSMKKRAFGS